MALVSKNIPNLINGVSQQPAALRLESQGEVQENGFSDVVDGLKKRPPTKFIKKLVDTNGDALTNLDDAFFHTYKRSDDVQFQVIITSAKKIYVYDIQGVLQYESGAGNTDNTDYLPSNPKDITATSVADATFIVNKEKVVEMDDYVYPSNDLYQALVYLKSVNYGRTYTVSAKSKTNPTEKLEASYTTNKAVASTASTGGNDDQLKVSAVMSETYSGNSACLREQLENDVGTILLDSFSYSTLPINSSIDIVNTQLLELSLTNVQSTQGAVSAGDITVQVGGVDIPYDANNVTGWCRISDNTIMLHYDILEDSFGTSDYERQPVYVTSTHGATNAGGFITPDVNDSDKEPYFIINTTKSGDIKDFDIKVTDDDGGVNLKAFKGTAKSFTSLPNQCETGFTLGVVGDNQKKEDDFHVKFEGAAGSGYWRETVANNLHNYFKLSSMPHTLRQLDDGTFKFGVAEDNDGNNWASRKAGDDNTNPNPSFVGQKIKDIFFHRNRLGVLAGENVIFSEAGGYLNFWRTTVRTLLDSDPIDVSVSQNEVADLKAAVPIQDNLLLFSELNQFTLSATQLLTPAEVTIDQSTKYECDLTATPVGAGTSVFFSTLSGGFSGVREFFTKTDTEIKDAPEITSHVPKYIKGQITDLKASSNEDMLVALTDADKTECYIYKWYNSSQERLQSSWSKWKFSKNIASVYFNNAELYFTFEDGSYESMDLAQLTNPVFLDHQFNTANAANVPDDFLTPTMIAITAEGYNLGTYDTNNLSQPILKHIADGNHLTIGEPYTFKYQMSEQVFKPVQGDSTKLARFQLRKMSFNFSNTGKFDVTVDSLGRDLSVATFTGRILGEPDNILGQAAIVPEGSFAVGVQSKPATTKITITNDTHLPSVFQSAEWEGFVVLRNQRL